MPKLHLEELENRITPSTLYWQGGYDQNSWLSARNWRDVNGITSSTYPGGTDKAVFASLAPDCFINAGNNPGAGEIILSSAYTHILYINGDLTIWGITNDSSLLAAGSINFGVGSKLDIRDDIFQWSGGKLGGGANKGIVYVDNNSTLNIISNALWLGCDLVVGREPDDTITNGTVNFATTLNQMYSNVTLYNNSTIEVEPLGKVYFNEIQTASEARGGVSTIGTGHFNNYGTVVRSRNANYNETVMIGLTYYSLGVNANTEIYSNLDFKHSDNIGVCCYLPFGTIEIGNTVHVYTGLGNNGTILGEGGFLCTEYDAAGGHAHSYIDGNLNMRAGKLVMSYEGGYGTLDISKTASFSGSVAITMYVQGGNGGHDCDVIDVTQNLLINQSDPANDHAAITIILNGAAPPAATEYGLIICLGTETGDFKTANISLPGKSWIFDWSDTNKEFFAMS
jgi:hypothetical protein